VADIDAVMTRGEVSTGGGHLTRTLLAEGGHARAVDRVNRRVKAQFDGRLHRN
jgi:hypothetical protein